MAAINVNEKMQARKRFKGRKVRKRVQVGYGKRFLAGVRSYINSLEKRKKVKNAKRRKR